VSGDPPDIDIEPPGRPEPHLRVVALDQEGIAERVGSDPLAPAYRVIADLGRSATAGYEVLVRIGDEPPMTPAGWSRRGHPVQAGAVESGLVEVALAARSALPRRRFVVVQVSTVALLSDPLLAVFQAAGALDGVVVAVADDADPVDAVAARTALRGLRDRGARLAVDDTGGSYASLQQIANLRPDFVRVGGTFVTGIEHDPARSAVVEAIIGLATRIGAEVIAADVASPAELRELRRLGAALAEGPLLGGIAPAMGELGEAAREAIGAAAPEPPDGAEATAAGVVELVAPLPAGGTLELMADRFLEDPRHDFLAVVDADGHPVALADRAALLRGEAYEHEPLLVRPATTLRALARRMAGRPAVDRVVPAVCCHCDGAYIGLVRIERVLDALGAEG
jgi:EAL domain-containing protein (putative c-di-GMP-specific phosphodiesterase class I)